MMMDCPMGGAQAPRVHWFVLAVDEVVYFLNPLQLECLAQRDQLAPAQNRVEQCGGHLPGNSVTFHSYLNSTSLLLK